MTPSSLAPTTPGYALFVTRIGVCAVAWGGQALLALQLPEADGAATQERMLRGLAQRRAVARLPAVNLAPWRGGVQLLPAHALQAMAGVQRLLAGPQAGAQDDAWCAPADPWVLGDLRAHDGGPPAWGKGGAGGAPLPDLRELPLDEQGVPAFHRRVYALARAIAPGHTRTYGELAQELGGPGLARAVGQALGANPFAPVVPCHRVLAAGRAPGGFSGGQGALTKLRMLELEGAAWGGTRSLFG